MYEMLYLMLGAIQAVHSAYVQAGMLQDCQACSYVRGTDGQKLDQ